MEKNQPNPSSEVAKFIKAARLAIGETQENFGTIFGFTKANISAWENGRHEPSYSILCKMSEKSGVPLPFLSSAPNCIHSGYLLESYDNTKEPCFEIEYTDARGSCGGGSINWDGRVIGKLAKEASWFTRYNIKPSDALVVFADGDSMADFIVNGDMVIFDRSKTAARSGAIFLIEHPDGLRIKQLRREIDGTWVLESRNPDKRSFPDERIPPSHSDLLIVRGEFVYRQGG